jgi:hypothetical protein
MASSQVTLKETSQTRRGGRMLTPRPFIGLRILVLGLGFFGLLTLFATDVHAGCPPPTGFRYIGGACYYVKGVEIEAEVNHTGRTPQKDGKTFAADINVTGSTGIVFCVNKPGKQPPGQKLVPVDSGDTLSCSTAVTNVVSSLNGGTGKAVCTALLTATDLSFYSQYCPSGQVAIDFVPISFLSDVTYSDDAGTIESARHSCSLPNPETLQWDRTTNRPERRAYDCLGPLP